MISHKVKKKLRSGLKLGISWHGFARHEEQEHGDARQVVCNIIACYAPDKSLLRCEHHCLAIGSFLSHILPSWFGRENPAFFLNLDTFMRDIVICRVHEFMSCTANKLWLNRTPSYFFVLFLIPFTQVILFIYFVFSNYLCKNETQKTQGRQF